MTPLPGSALHPSEVTERIGAAWKSMPTDYVPRTHHLQPDGRPVFTNRLFLETSPYLLQHAHNPVDWYPWGDEAFARARAEDKPVLLSVGYSTCHWCHVMERESFEDTEIAAFINAHFIPVKVDREERPDVDTVYMTAVQALTGHGGWPMTVVMTADRQPFFGGTYFPARDGDRGAQRGFLSILALLDEGWKNDREKVLNHAADFSKHLERLAEPLAPRDMPTTQAVKAAVSQLASSYDPAWGGFGGAPKFPRPVALGLLLRAHRRTGDARSLEMVLHTLRRMAAGGMYDLVGGGFHRYSVDARWLVPHFEKMLYDQAQLAVIYLEAWQLSGDADLARVARETLDYVERELVDEAGGIHSATDADSPTPTGESEEGWFFTWTPDELRAVLGDRAPAVEAAWGVTAAGNFEGRTILNVPRPLDDVARGLGMEPAALTELLADARADLYRARAERPPPIEDDKVITAWNGLMISAYARGGLVLAEPRYVAVAVRAADFLLRRARDESGRLLRTWRAGRAAHPAVLEDYAFLVQGLLDLYEANGELRWLTEAIRLQKACDAGFLDTERGGWYQTAGDAEALLTRSKPDYDGAEPSGNSVAILNVQRLHTLTGDEEWRRRGERALQALADRITRTPTAAPLLVAALEAYHDVPREVIVLGAAGDREALWSVARRTYLPNRALIALDPAGARAQEGTVPLLELKDLLDGRATAYVCERGLCEAPTHEPEVLAAQLRKTHPF